MRLATDLREIILIKAKELFIRQGFTATSIKDIAKVAGCTTAALYYYFEGGKSQILREVIRSYSLNLQQVFEPCREAATLQSFLVQFGQLMSQVLPGLLADINWLLLEYGSLTADDKAYLHRQFDDLHTLTSQELQRFVEPTQAGKLAWVILCSYFGYGQVFISMQGDQFSDLKFEDFASTLAHFVSQAKS